MSYTIANFNDDMLGRPDLYASTPQELEASLLTALQCWNLPLQEGAVKGKVVGMWRDISRRVSTQPASVASLSDMGHQAVVDGMAEIWQKLRHPLEQLATTADDC